MKLTKQQGDYLDSITKMTNDELFDLVLDVNQPDDYDGYFTDYGDMLKDFVNDEMVKRLKETNFLSEDYIESYK